MSVIYIPSSYSAVITVDTNTLNYSKVKTQYIEVGTATEPGQLLDYAGVTQNVNVGDILFISDNKVSLIATVNDFITNVVLKQHDDKDVPSTNTASQPLTITLTGTAIATPAEVITSNV